MRPGSTRCKEILFWGPAMLLWLWVLAPGMSAAECIDYREYIRPIGGVNIQSQHARGLDVQGAYAYVAGDTTGLKVVDVSDPAAARIVGGANTPGKSYAVDVDGALAYVADGNAGLVIIDVADPTRPAIIGSLDTPGMAVDVAVSGTLAYVADDYGRFRVIDVSDPVNPTQISWTNTPGYAESVALSGHYAFVASAYEGLQVVDIIDPWSPAVVGHVALPDYASSVQLDGNLAYVAIRPGSMGGMAIIDVTLPRMPRLLGFLEMHGMVWDVSAANGYAFAGNYLGMHVIDVRDPAHPTEIGMVPAYGSWQNAVLATGGLVYLANGSPGNLQITDVSALAFPQTLGGVDLADTRHVDVAGSTAFCCDYSGLFQAIDVSDLRNPLVLGTLTTGLHPRESRVRTGYAYMVDEDRFWVIDVSDPASMQSIASIDPAGRTIDMALQGSYACFLEYSTWLFSMVDVSDPAQPVVTATIDQTGNAVDMQGDIACIVNGSSGLSWFKVMDISDPYSPYRIGIVWMPPPITANDVAIAGTYAYVPTSEDGLHVFDISDPTNPTDIASVFFAGGERVTVSDDLAYVGCGSDGLQIVDISDPTSPRLVTGVATQTRHASVANGLVYEADGESGLWIRPVQCELGAAAPEVIGRPAPRLRVSPNPSAGRVTIAFDSRRDGIASLEVLDVEGRLVRTLAHGTTRPGAGALLWDGRDDRGRPVAGGIYLVRIRTPKGSSAAEKISLIR